MIETNFSSSWQNITEAFAFERFLSKLYIPKVKNISIIITTWRWINRFNTYCFYLIVAKRITKKKPLVEFLSIAPYSPRPPKPDTNCQKKETLYKIKLITSLLLTYSAPKFESNCSRNNIFLILTTERIRMSLLMKPKIPQIDGLNECYLFFSCRFPS